MARKLPYKPYTFFQWINIQLDGHKGADGAEMECQVEYTCTPGVAATWDHPAEGDEIEIVTIRPLKEIRYDSKTGRKLAPAFHDCPRWLESLLEGCINVNELDPDWSEYADGYDY